ncbi:predicted protein [Nematostella vectensis]|uniref:G-protein coupled receptors family 1 profile domain-containing protein n=1 Tax=Nematostella vectensis TaxID=45351 RepID=A7S3W6_NEMVE|nr:predicted protein [Nematostella vectensis]|eukprot:XP_001633621.1 predicted protein [Nematostella vectensis]
MENSTFSPEDTEDHQVPFPALVAILSPMSLGTICGNLLVLISIWTQPSLQLPNFMAIGSLAMADLLVGVFAMPAYVIKKSPLALGEFWEGFVCDVFRFSYFLSGYASILSLCIISIDRMLTIRNPLTYHTLVTQYRVTVTLVVAWIDAIGISVLPFLPTGVPQGLPCHYSPAGWWSIMVIVTNVVVPFVIIMLCYTDMYCTARGHLRRIQTHNTNSRQSSQDKRQRSGTRTISIVIGLFVISWFPSCVYYFLKEVCDACYPPSFAPLEGIFNSLAKLLTFAGSFWNPLIYCWRSSEFRSAFLRILSRRKEYNASY